MENEEDCKYFTVQNIVFVLLQYNASIKENQIFSITWGIAYFNYGWFLRKLFYINIEYITLVFVEKKIIQTYLETLFKVFHYIILSKMKHTTCLATKIYCLLFK